MKTLNLYLNIFEKVHKKLYHQRYDLYQAKAKGDNRTIENSHSRHRY